MVNELRTFGDPVLRLQATSVKDFDGSLSQLVEDMMRIMRENEGVGLAANQIGHLKRIFVASYEDEEFVIANPIIEQRSESTETHVEGCLSLPEIRVEVERPYAVTVSGKNLSGKSMWVEAEGLLARIFQHEIDHLNGILILDRADRESRKNALRELRKRLVAHH